MELKKILFLFSVVITCVWRTGYASWTGPVEEISGTWGNQPGQFSINYQDTHDIFPTTIAVSSTGLVAVSEDQTIKRVQIFKRGKLEKNIDTFAFDLVYLNNDLFVSGGGLRKYDSTGNLIWSKPETSFVALYATFNGNIVGFNRKEKKYYLFSPAGNLINTSIMEPLELGRISVNSAGEKLYSITVQYPDKTYTMTSETTFKRFVRNGNGYIYGVNNSGVWEFNECGEKVAEVLMPNPGTEAVPVPELKGRSIVTDTEYGWPVVAPNGDVYTWKKGEFKYSILKWTWVAEPNNSKKICK